MLNRKIMQQLPTVPLPHLGHAQHALTLGTRGPFETAVRLRAAWLRRAPGGHVNE